MFYVVTIPDNTVVNSVCTNCDPFSMKQACILEHYVKHAFLTLRILLLQVLYYWEATNCAVSKDNAKKSA